MLGNPGKILHDELQRSDLMMHSPEAEIAAATADWAALSRPWRKYAALNSIEEIQRRSPNAPGELRTTNRWEVSLGIPGAGSPPFGSGHGYAIGVGDGPRLWGGVYITHRWCRRQLQ